MNNTCCGHKNPLFIYELIDNSHIWLCAACVLFVYVKRTHSYVARYAGTHFTFVREIRPWRHRDISFAILFFFLIFFLFIASHWVFTQVNSRPLCFFIFFLAIIFFVLVPISVTTLFFGLPWCRCYVVSYGLILQYSMRCAMAFSFQGEVQLEEQQMSPNLMTISVIPLWLNSNPKKQNIINQFNGSTRVYILHW